MSLKPSIVTQRPLSRREFLVTSTIGAISTAFGLAADTEPAAEPIIDIHQHVESGGRLDAQGRLVSPGRSSEQLIAHQRAMGVTRTILLPAGHAVRRASTLDGRANGLGDGNNAGGTCAPNEACYALAKAHPDKFAFGANEVSDLANAPQEIEKYLKLGAVMIGEQKFGVECDSPSMRRLYELAAEYNAPILMHWQINSYNHGFERFYKMLERFPKTNFIGHAQTWWANIDLDNKDDARNLYPKGKVTPGGLTERYLRDYPNMYGDLAGNSGYNAFRRDGDGRTFLERHQDKLLYGSDCIDTIGQGPRCVGALQIEILRNLSPTKAIERKLLHDNAKKLFSL